MGGGSSRTSLVVDLHGLTPPITYPNVANLQRQMDSYMPAFDGVAGSRTEPPLPTNDDAGAHLEDLTEQKLSVLKARCVEFGLDPTGRKAALIKRLELHLHPPAAAPAEVPEVSQLQETPASAEHSEEKRAVTFGAAAIVQSVAATPVVRTIGHLRASAVLVVPEDAPEIFDVGEADSDLVYLQKSSASKVVEMLGNEATAGGSRRRTVPRSEARVRQRVGRDDCRRRAVLATAQREVQLAKARRVDDHHRR